MVSYREKLKLRVYKPWHEQVSLEEAKAAHAENVGRIEDALEKRKDPNRPFHVVGVVGSSRNRTTSCAHETSNSMKIMQKAMSAYRDLGDVTTQVIDLSNKTLEPCNGCYSSTSSLCRFPCDCFPLDDLQSIYAAFTLADGIIFSSGVNENNMSSRLKIVIDRLISMDGGRFAPQYNVDGKTWKDSNSKQGELEVALTGKFPYRQRLTGRVIGCLITGKDYGAYKVGFDIISAMADYGCITPSNPVAYWHSPHVEADTAFDKADLMHALEKGDMGVMCVSVAENVLNLARLVRGHQDKFTEVMVGRA